MLISDASKIAFVRATLAALLLGLTALIVIVLFNLWLVREAGVYSERVSAARLQRTAIIDLQNLILGRRDWTAWLSAYWQSCLFKALS